LYSGTISVIPALFTITCGQFAEVNGRFISFIDHWRTPKVIGHQYINYGTEPFPRRFEHIFHVLQLGNIGYYEKQSFLILSALYLRRSLLLYPHGSLLCKRFRIIADRTTYFDLAIVLINFVPNS
jgi:hypothetical protein